MTMITSATTLARYLNVSGRALSWHDPFGRVIRLAPGRGCFAAPSPELAKLIGEGAVIQPCDRRLDAVTLPNSTDRRL